jgi:hypothetical protein
MNEFHHQDTPELPSIKALADQAAEAIAAQREEILTAFVAKHGYHPEQAVQVVRQLPGGMRWHIEPRMDSLTDVLKTWGQQFDQLATPEQLTRAKTLYEREGHIEIDADAVVSEGCDPGFYILGWLWVPDEEAEED